MFDLKTNACSDKVQYGEKIPVKAGDMPAICTRTTFAQSDLKVRGWIVDIQDRYSF